MLLQRPVTAFMLILATFIFGFVALKELSVDLLPNIDAPTLMVQVEWSGASSREIETRILEPLEGILGTVPGVKETKGFARQGQAVLAIEFEWGRDMNLAFLNTREKLDLIRNSLPQAAGRPQLLYSNPSDEPIAVLGIRTKGVTETDFTTKLELKRWTEQVFARRLEQQQGVAQAIVVGAVVPEIHIKYDQSKADLYGISPNTIENEIKQANLFSSAGELRDGWYRYSVNVESRLKSVQQLIDLPIARLAGQKIIRLRDIAEIRLEQQDPTSFSMLDGSDILTVLIKKDYGANTVSVYESVLPLLDELRKQYPGIDIQLLYENATYIRNTIENLLQTLLLGGILAFLVLFLFLNDPRLPFTIGIAIPVSILLTFFVMYLLDIQLNIVSLSGLTLGIGLLVDNAIVVLENINRYRDEGQDVLSAAARGTKEIAFAITASTLTTISVFLPLVFLGGFEGAFFRDQAFTLSISLLASLLVAIGILPVLVVQLRKRSTSTTQATEQRRFTAMFDAVLLHYEAGLHWAMKHPFPTFSVATVLLFLAVGAFLFIPKQLMPETEVRRLSYRVTLSSNSSIRYAQEVARKLVNHLNDEQSESGIVVLGGYTDQTNLVQLSKEGLHRFRMEIPVRDEVHLSELRQKVTQFGASSPETAIEEDVEQGVLGQIISSSGSPVVFHLIQSDRDKSEALVPSLAAHLGLDDASTLFKLYPETMEAYHVHFDAQRLLQLNITQQQVIHDLETRARGANMTEWNRDDENVVVRLFTKQTEQVDPAELSFYSRGRLIRLSDVARIERVSEPLQLERINQTSVLTYGSAFTLADWWWNAAEIKANVLNFVRKTGLQVRIGGTALQVDKLLRDMGTLLLISFIMIYIIMAIQFENLKYPFIILFSIPFAWIGSIGLLYIAGSSLNSLSFMGILILTGIAVNDAILKVDFMRRYYEETGHLEESITLAGKHRFRPVIMTSLTTILGLLPMIFPIGDGYEFRQSLSLALMGGLITSTLLTLFVVPLIFRYVVGATSSTSKP